MFQVRGLAKTDKNRLIGTADDGETQVTCSFSTKYTKLYDEKKLASDDLVTLESFSAAVYDGKARLMVLELEVHGKYTGPDPLSTEAGPVPAQNKKQKTDGIDNQASPTPAAAQYVHPRLNPALSC